MVAFSIGAVNFYWYGMIIAAAVLSGLLISIWQAKYRCLARMLVLNLSLILIPVSIVCAKIYYLVINGAMQDNPVTIMESWHKGFSIEGAALGGIIVIYKYTHIFNQPFGALLDVLTPGLALGQAVGQCANLITQEHIGYPTNAPWGIYVDYALRPPGYESYEYFHPIFLYDALLNLILFGITLALNYIYSHNKSIISGFTIIVYLLLYLSGRVSLECLFRAV